MATFCISRVVAEKMKQSVQDGEISIQDLYNTDSAGRRAVFERFADEDLAHKINAEFERAMVSKRKNAMASWAKEFLRGNKRTKTSTSQLLKRLMNSMSLMF